MKITLVPEFRKRCAAYLHRSGETALVVALNQETGPMAGVYYETDNVWQGSYSDFHALGIQVAKACAASERRFHLATRRNMKQSDWPAFRASATKTLKQFQSEFVRYAIEGAGAGHFLTIESQEIGGDIQLRTTANAGDPLDLGDKICRMHKYFLRWQAHPSGQNRSELAQ